MKNLYNLNLTGKKSLACLPFFFSLAITLAGNPLAAANVLPVTPPSEWDIGESGNLSIQNFAKDISISTENVDMQQAGLNSLEENSLNNRTENILDPGYNTVFQFVSPPSWSLNFIGDGLSSLELGMKFHSSQDGYIAGFAYYKGLEAKGEHIGNLWSINGTNLSTAIFSNETDSGWQVALLDTPVAIQADSIYVVSYFSPHGDYVKTDSYFTTEIRNGPLTALKWSEEEPNGVYIYSDTSAFPNNNEFVGSTNYWVDVIMLTSLTGINDSPSNAVGCFDMYPNPASDQLTVTTNSAMYGTIRILDIQGKEVVQRKFITPIITIDCSNLPAGIYIVQVTNGKTGMLTIKRLVIRK